MSACLEGLLTCCTTRCPACCQPVLPPQLQLAAAGVETQVAQQVEVLRLQAESPVNLAAALAGRQVGTLMTKHIHRLPSYLLY